MIVDNIKNIDNYSFNNLNLCKAFDFIKCNSLKDIPVGKIDINGQDLYAICSSYIPKRNEDVLWEAHRQYIDVQYIVEGEELIGYASIDDLEIVSSYDKAQDVVLGTVNGSYIRMKTGDFMMLFPNDAHKPGIIYQNHNKVRKVVFKVRF